jgi:hypothetical protein
MEWRLRWGTWICVCRKLLRSSAQRQPSHLWRFGRKGDCFGTGKWPIKPIYIEYFPALVDAASQDKKSMRTRTKRNADNYRITIRPLSKEEGGGVSGDSRMHVGWPNHRGSGCEWQRGTERLPRCFPGVWQESSEARGLAGAVEATIAAHTVYATHRASERRGRKYQQSCDGNDC